MIKINDTYLVERDKYQWVLIERRPPGAHPITGEIGKADSESRSYHSNFGQAMKHAADQSCQGVETFLSLERIYLSLVADLERVAAELEPAVSEALDSEN